MTSNLLNPKVALFVLAFFPQFISPDAAGELAPFMMLGISYAAIGTVWYLLFGWLAGSLGESLLKKPAVAKWLDRASAVVFILLGFKIAAAER